MDLNNLIHAYSIRSKNKYAEVYRESQVSKSRHGYIPYSLEMVPEAVLAVSRCRKV